MRIISVIATWALVGVLVGAALAYVELRLDNDAIARLPGDVNDPNVVKANEVAARIEVDEPNFKFGAMQRGTHKSHEFTIRNIGQSPLKLRVGGTSCKCTLGEVSEKPLPPNETTKVK